MRGFRIENGRRPGQQRIELNRAVARRADDDHVLEARDARAIDRVEFLQQRFADHHHPGAAVVERMRVIAGAPQRVERNGNDARLDRAEEAVGECRGVLQDQRDALLGLDAEVLQRGAEAVDALGHLRIRDALIAALDRDLPAASFGQVAIDKMGGGVEDVRQHGHAGILVEPGEGRR